MKGAYPYLADNGTAVVVDLLMNEPGQLDVQKAEYGYRVAASTTAPAAAAVELPPAALAPTVAVETPVKAEAPAVEKPAPAPAAEAETPAEGAAVPATGETPIKTELPAGQQPKTEGKKS